MQSLRNGFLLFGLLFLSSPVFAKAYYKDEIIVARHCPRFCDLLIDGFYLGIGLGVDEYRFRESVEITPIADPVLSAGGGAVSFIGGYSQFYDWFYVAGEISANWDNASARYATGAGSNSLSSQLSIHHSYKASMLLGFRANWFANPYFRLGYARSLVKTSEQGTNAGLAFYNNETNWMDGFDFGVGIESYILPCISVRSEFTHTWYGSFKTRIDTGFNASNNQFMLSMLYHFNY